MAFVGIGLALLFAALGVLVVGSAAAAFTSGGSAAMVLGLGAALLLCLLLPLLLERRLTRAFRRLEPNAKGMLFQTLALVNAVWLALLILLTPRFVRLAIEQRGAGLLSGHSRTVESWILRTVALIPRSGDPKPNTVPPAKPSATAKLAAGAPSASAIESSAPAVVAAPAPAVIREAPEASEDTPAAKVYRERAGSVVVIHTYTPAPSSGPLAKIYEQLGVSSSEGLGSGFIVDAAGLIVTNHHVIEGATALQIVSKEGVRFNDVSVLVDDAHNDLALLSVEAKDLPTAPLSTTKAVAIGSRAIAIGCPLGFEYTLTEGIVSAHRNLEGTRFLQMQTGIAPGSSGGPLFDQHGAVIGVNTATSGSSLNLAVDVAEVKQLLGLPRKAKALEHFETAPRLASLETEGAELDPTTRMGLREAGGLLGNIAKKCAKPLPDAAQFTFYLSASLTSPGRAESNLSPEAERCMTSALRLLGLQISLLFMQSAKPPTALHIVIADLPREDGTRGQLAFHFKI